MEKFDDGNGVWRTIRGRRVFIREGESLGSAMARSGKFKREDIRTARAGISQEDRFQRVKNKSLKERQKETRKMQSKDNRFTNSIYAMNKKEEKNVPSSYMPANREGKTRVERYKEKYSDTDRRELRHEQVQKKLADYKAKKQSNNKVEIKNNKGELTGYTNNERIEYHHSGDTGLMASVYSTGEEDLLHGHFFNIPKEYQEGDKLKDYTLKEIERLKSDRKAYLQRQEAGIPEESKYKNQVKVKGDRNVIPRDFTKGYGKFKTETTANKENKDDRFEITKDDSGWHAKNLRTGETYATFREHLSNNNLFEFEDNKNETIKNYVDKKKPSVKVSYQKNWAKDGTTMTQSVKIDNDTKESINKAIKQEIDSGYKNYKNYASDINSAKRYLENLNDDYTDTTLTTNRFIQNYLGNEKIKKDRNTRYIIEAYKKRKGK